MKTNRYIFAKRFLLYIAKFGLLFCIFYFGSLAIIGLSISPGYYSSFIDKHLNFIEWLRLSLLWSSKKFLTLLGYQTYFYNKYTLLLKNSKGIRMVYSCVGYGVMSFWAALVIANNGKWLKKIKWVFFGLSALWFINVLRISTIVIFANKKNIILSFDNHTWFNIAAYLLIFMLIYFYDKSLTYNLQT